MMREKEGMWECGNVGRLGGEVKQKSGGGAEEIRGEMKLAGYSRQLRILRV